MTIKARSENEILYLQESIITFLKEFEQLYVGKNPENIFKARLCVFQLIHVPWHIVWNGSIRIGSQATVERSIGELSHKIQSKKSIFSNLSNLIYEREQLRILILYFPEFDDTKKKSNSSIKGIKKMKIPKKNKMLIQLWFSTWIKLACF